MLRNKEFLGIGIILVIALIQGLIFIFLMPPWQHYDEPNHFEYVWLLANRQEIPNPGDFDSNLSLAVLRSMANNDFYRGVSSQPDLETLGEEVRIHGLSQLGDPPLYYFLASIPVRLFSQFSIETQLYSARFISFLLYLLSIVAAWGLTRDLTGKGNPLRLMVPFSMVMLPGFTDLMTAVNNDAGAIAFFSIFLWVSVRLIDRGVTLAGVMLVIGSALLCIFTRNTVIIAVALVPIVILLAIFRKQPQWLIWGTLVGFVIVGLLFTFSWGDAALWGRDVPQSSPTRSYNEKTPLGDFTFRIETPSSKNAGHRFGVFQILDINPLGAIKDRTVTVGAWIWADQSTSARTPILYTFDGSEIFSEEVELSRVPTFYAYHAAIAGSAERNWISLNPGITNSGQPVTVYYDGVTLVDGEMPLDQIPVFDDGSGETGQWGYEKFVNLVRNPSAKNSWMWFRPWVDTLGKKILPDANTPSIILYTVTDLQKLNRGIFYYTNLRIFRTFWGKFGWDHIPIIGYSPYRDLAFFTFIGLVGAVFWIWHNKSVINLSILLLLLLVIVVLWFQTLTRSSNYFIQLRPLYIPVARYIYPVIVPVLLILNMGWLEILKFVKRVFNSRTQSSQVFTLCCL